MNIIVDAFGGDNAPLEVIKGCRMAREKLGTDITLTGNRDIIEKTARENGIDISDMRNMGFFVKHCLIKMCDAPALWNIKGKLLCKCCRSLPRDRIAPGAERYK